MNTDQRYNRDEISRILKRAAELEHSDNIEDDSEGLTADELQQVSKEVGIHPRYIIQALEELANPKQSTSVNLLGGPFTYQHLASAQGTLAEEEWEDIVSEIRRIHGGIGKTGRLGNTFEWEQRKREVGYIQIALSPKTNHTKISINANYSYYASVIYIFIGTCAFMFVMMLFKNVELSFAVQAIMAVSGILGLFGMGHFYLSRWMKKKRKTYAKLIQRFREMLEPVQEREPAPSISIPDAETDKTESDVNRTASPNRNAGRN